MKTFDEFLKKDENIVEANLAKEIQKLDKYDDSTIIDIKDLYDELKNSLSLLRSLKLIAQNNPKFKSEYENLKKIMDLAQKTQF